MDFPAIVQDSPVKAHNNNNNNNSIWGCMWNISDIELRMWNQEVMILAVMNAIYAIAYIEAWKIQDFNGVWTLDLAIPVRRS